MYVVFLMVGGFVYLVRMVKSRDRNAIDGNALNSGQTRTSNLNERDGFLIFYLARKYGIKEISMKWVFTLS